MLAETDRPIRVCVVGGYDHGKDGDLLRGYLHRLQSVAEIEGIVRYHHQGGGQDRAGQIRVPYNNKDEGEIRIRHSILQPTLSHYHHTTT